MEEKTTSVFTLCDASEINITLDSLPTVRPVKLSYGEDHRELDKLNKELFVEL